ncbi:MAG: hypothetical protein DMG65_01710 [Candidatus Angelobacter sp. Gp1-AA117]|nr:MAG: hypothetical protein DMG65_01710 [Candidatus Angelobacter sp. Gp1-AA117]
MSSRWLVAAFIFSVCWIVGCNHSNGGTPAQASGAEKPKGAKEIVLPASQQGDGLLQFEAVQLANQAEYKPYREKLFLLMIEAGTWE